MGRIPGYKAAFMAQNNSASLEKGKAKDLALVFIADMDTPGAKLICRNSHEDKVMSPLSRWSRKAGHVTRRSSDYGPWPNSASRQEK